MSMESMTAHSKFVVLFLATRPKFLTASVAPVLVGSAAGYAFTGTFQPALFILALLSIMLLHCGANITNDYYDHLSGNDWVNKNPTPFSGGRRFIQEGILSPRATLLAALFCLAAGSAIGLVILYMTRSVFILALGLVGLLGGFFYTARPIQLGYRSIGELFIAVLFGLLPVFGSYYLQTKTIEGIVLLPACIVSILIFLVILVNEFPDSIADTSVNKRTLVVSFGVLAGAWIYRTTLIISYILAAAMLVTPAATAYLLARRLLPMMLVSAAIGGISSLIGLYISYYLNIVSGSAIVLAATVIFILVFLFHPGHGVVWNNKNA